MTYIRRAFKYFLQVSLTLALVIAVLMISGLVSKDVSVAFTRGWNSVWLIEGVFAVVSALYPLLGYSHRKLSLNGDPAEYRNGIVQAMERRSYVLEKEEDGMMTFRLSSPLNRLARFYEDRITIRPILGGFDLEGLTRDLVRVVMLLDRKLNQYDD